MAGVNVLVVIPARFQSSRFPGKPLVDLHGSPLIEHVWKRCCRVVDATDVVVATDDERIASVASDFGAIVEMTSTECLTGTDRVAEVASRRDADWYVNVQGDEPLIDPQSILEMIHRVHSEPESTLALNAMSPISVERDFRSTSVPKVVTDRSDFLLYISRAPIPTDKQHRFSFGWRQVGLYAYRPQALNYFSPDSNKGTLEALEDIEILRLLENGKPVKMIRVPEASPAVDTPDDLARVRQIMLEQGIDQ